ncbi:MAG: HAMP domain-containing sensor histidine kinase [Pseudomonadota bacterium]
MRRKWRPPLALVLGGALAGTLAVSFAGLIAFRYLGQDIGFRNAAMLVALAIAVVTAILGLLLIRLLLRPVRALSHYASDARGGAGRNTPPPDHFGTRELGTMAEAVIAMAEAFRTREATIRSYSDHVTHELKSPVTAVAAAAELLQDRAQPGPDRVLVDQIADAAHQMNAQLDALRQVARAREADYRGKTTLAGVLPGLHRRFDALEIDAAHAQAELPLSADGMRIVLDHLLANARAAGASRVDLRADPAGRLVVADNGPGVPESEQGHIFEPLYTTRRETGGTGMGLAIVRNVLAAHGAFIALRPSTTGAAFEITFDTR